MPTMAAMIRMIIAIRRALKQLSCRSSGVANQSMNPKMKPIKIFMTKIVQFNFGDISQVNTCLLSLPNGYC